MYHETEADNMREFITKYGQLCREHWLMVQHDGDGFYVDPLMAAMARLEITEHLKQLRKSVRDYEWSEEAAELLNDNY